MLYTGCYICIGKSVAEESGHQSESEGTQQLHETEQSEYAQGKGSVGERSIQVWLDVLSIGGGGGGGGGKVITKWSKYMEPHVCLYMYL